MAAKHQRSYEDFEPPVESSHEDGCDVLAIYIPGFSKEQLRVQVSSTRALRISGERPFRNKTWQRFHKEFQIPPNCNTSNITAKYKGGILHIRLPLAAPKPKPPPEHETVKQQAEAETETEAAEKKSSVAATSAKVEGKSRKEKEETCVNCAEKAGKDMTKLGANIWNKFSGIMLVKLILLPVLVAVLLFMYGKRLSSTGFVGVEEPPQTEY